MLTFSAENERLTNHLLLAPFLLISLIYKDLCILGCSFLNLAKVSLETRKCRQMSAANVFGKCTKYVIN